MIRFRSRLVRPHLIVAAVLAMAGLLLAAQGSWMHAKAKLAQLLLERAFAETVKTGQPAKPWSWADTWPIARITVPRLNAHAIVLHGSSGQALAFGPGHVETTPPAGSPGTAVYSAHRDTHFRFVKDVVAGDEIVATLASGKTHRFRVTHTSVVRWDRSGIDPFADGRNLILATCWPLESKLPGPLRYLVHAELIGEDGKERSSPAGAEPAHDKPQTSEGQPERNRVARASGNNGR